MDAYYLFRKQGRRGLNRWRNCCWAGWIWVGVDE